ncbi:MAG TPA: alpha/beta hydrolase fold domain-containing protein [Pirellulaceae bacterium]|nr:alpha/beta hydrolase fold domain-containing protein [Pirellulaceae bacterium]
MNTQVGLFSATVLILSLAPAPGPAQEPRQDLFTRLDANTDGKLSKDELPARQQPNFEKMDANGDGFVSREELTAYLGRERAVDDQASRARIEPTHADVSYGLHERNKIDLYLAEVNTPTPLVLYIHGGGFRGGDKNSVSQGDLRAFLNEGWSLAAINYRLTDAAPAPAQYLDCARALQFLRHNAGKWNLNPKLVASTGGSAGAGTSMWLAFHDDLADAKNTDPITRESTRLTCIAVSNGQSSYDPRFAEKIGIPRPNFERHAFFEPFYDIKLADADTPQAYRRYEEAAAITYLTRDDPPALLQYSYANEEVTPNTSLGLIVHHPKFGIALKEEMDKLGIECIVQYRALDSNRTVRHGDGDLVRTVDFFRKHFD